jgi:hypothetical protein
MTDISFWFDQPALILSLEDKIFNYLFLGLAAAAIMLFLARYLLLKHPMVRKLAIRIIRLFTVTALTGLVWFGFRYENTPIFARRYWAGIILAIGLVWLLFILKYIIFRFREEKKEFDENLIKSRYLPKLK